MTKRADAVAETRRRIVDATLELHREQGIQPTSWEDIAERAGVGIGTVYRHFRSLDELVPACGVVTFELLDLPSRGEVDELFRGLRGRRARMHRLVAEVFALYERGAPEIENVRRERDSLPHLLEDSHELIEDALDRLVRAALEPFEPTRRDLNVARALTDLRVWRSLRERGVEGDEAVELVAGLLV